MINNTLVSKNFRLKEFECKDGSHLVMVDERLVEKLQALRDKAGKPVVVLSGYRTPAYNKQVGGADDSYHMKGMAADIRIEGYTPEQVARLAEEVGFDGIGIYPPNKDRAGFTHVDVRRFRARWTG